MRAAAPGAPPVPVAEAAVPQPLATAVPEPVASAVPQKPPPVQKTPYAVVVGWLTDPSDDGEELCCGPI